MSHSKESCVFCRIVSNELPSYKVYEDEKCVAFLDAKPVNHGHLLVVSKEHYETITDMPSTVFKHISGVVQDLARTVETKMDPDGIKIVQNNGAQAGQAVFHFHIHLIPRYEGDEVNYLEEWTTQELSAVEMNRIASLLKKK
ncbi:MAG TPA: HIT family protein [Candidatus Nanoarchaeia archaeon]|nr:HIT family protein [Candidatus Nanoarchaeia archaeon]